MRYCIQSGIEIFDNEMEDLFDAIRETVDNADVWLDAPNVLFRLQTPRSMILAGGGKAEQVRNWARQVAHGMPS